MGLNLDSHIRTAPNPETAAIRMDRLLALKGVEDRLRRMEDSVRKDLVTIISFSNFLFNFLVRHPDAIVCVGNRPRSDDRELVSITDLDALRHYKYKELLKIAWMDICTRVDYGLVLTALSKLAIDIVRQGLRLALEHDSYQTFTRSMAVMALGKLGANELNFSSDIDLIFVSVNPDKSIDEFHALQQSLHASIRSLTRKLEEQTAGGFLYRVDLKLRPWGKSGPLCMAIDDTEHYYAVSSVPWERFAWIRARLVAGSEMLGNDMLLRIRPFVYRRSLSTDDLNNFIAIKNEMCDARKKRGHWNVKVGEGGIRDVEFFIQMLQIANGGGERKLQTSSTLNALPVLQDTGLINAVESEEIKESYLFLRRLENRLQIVDERQTHDLPDDRDKRLVIARSLDGSGAEDTMILNQFEERLLTHRSIAKKYFDRILPAARVE